MTMMAEGCRAGINIAMSHLLYKPRLKSSPTTPDYSLGEFSVALFVTTML